MAEAPYRIVKACLDSPASGVVEFDRDWTAAGAPALALSPDGPRLIELSPAPPLAAGRAYGYYLSGPDEITFVFPPEASLDGGHETVYLAGDFNGWEQAVDRPEWRLEPAVLEGEAVLLWRGRAADFLRQPPPRFKFVTNEHLWPAIPSEAGNVERDEHGYLNRRVDPRRTGRHLWRFVADGSLELSRKWAVSLQGAGPPEPLVPGKFFFELRTELPLGARIEDGRTVFRLFAPRLRAVTVHLQSRLDGAGDSAAQPLARRPDDPQVWEAAVPGNLHGWYYWYTVERGDAPAWPDAPARVLDPYALAAVGREGPGIVLERARLGRGDADFPTPAWHDLVIAEAHVRDLTAQAPIAATAEERRGFTGLRRWVESPEFYLADLGVNCVELQPVQEFDNAKPGDYHWGYMPCNWFAPASAYALAPADASGIRELQELVGAFHARGLAVILDVVYNHAGLPCHLAAIDAGYYFDHDAAGRPTNWSGCGNDLRADAAMAERLILDSLRHLLEVFGVDGFRFDLAELLGLPRLRRIEAALKAARPGVILIAEPWSLRGHLAGALRETGWASWNDGYRDFVREYVLGRGGSDRLEYFLRGSPWYFAKWPAQTVNYTQSHDDRAWIDLVTERPGADGSDPTAADRRRTRLMASILFMSLGIPMLAQGQDFLHSKRGATNTYLRGDLNALDYRRLGRELETHGYFADWIGFRLGEHGRLLRHYTRPSEGFFAFLRPAGTPALAVLCNADGSQGGERLLYAVNPTGGEVTIDAGAASAGRLWRQWADQDRFFPRPLWPGPDLAAGRLVLPPLSCGLWTSDE